MDRRVKERLVGASILLVLIVLIVPELLSGPAPSPATRTEPVTEPITEPITEPVRNVTVDLATRKPQAPEPASAPPEEAPSTPAASAAEPAPPLETQPPAPNSALPAAKQAAGAGHAWSVQLGSFASHANADKLVRQLKAQGFPVFVLPGGSGASLRYKVRVGPLNDRTAATQAVAKLNSSGHTGTLVPPAP